MNVNEYFNADLDESVKMKLNELKEIQAKLDEALAMYKNSIAELEATKSNLVPEIMSIFDGQVDPGKKLKLDIDNLLVEVTQESERLTASYKNAFEMALQKVNQNTRAVLEQILQDTKVVGKVKGQLKIDGTKVYEGAIVEWLGSVKSWLGKAYDKLTSFSNKASEGVDEIEAMIKDLENQNDGEMASKNYDDFESGAIYESVNRMKSIIKF